MAAPHLILAVLFAIMGVQTGWALWTGLDDTSWRWWLKSALFALAWLLVCDQIRRGRAVKRSEPK